MCKFCEREETIGRKDQKVFMNDEHYLVYLGKRTIFGEQIGKVNYCPMCGKKLEE